MEEAPGDGSDVIEETNGFFGRGSVDGACSDETTKVGVDLFGRSVGDAEVVQSVSA